MLLRTVSTLSNKSTKDEESFQAAKYVSRLLQDFVLGESLGKGGFGEIIKVTHFLLKACVQAYGKTIYRIFIVVRLRTNSTKPRLLSK